MRACVRVCVWCGCMCVCQLMPFPLLWQTKCLKIYNGFIFQARPNILSFPDSRDSWKDECHLQQTLADLLSVCGPAERELPGSPPCHGSSVHFTACLLWVSWKNDNDPFSYPSKAINQKSLPRSWSRKGSVAKSACHSDEALHHGKRD